MSAVEIPAVAEPRDTLVVVGGRRLSRVDADAVTSAAAHLDDAAARLRVAAFRCATAASDLERSLWATEPFHDADTADPASRRQAMALASDVAGRLSERAAACALVGDRLRLAAGLYRRTESAAERVLGGLVTVLAAGVAHGATVALRSRTVAPVVDAAATAGAWLVTRPGTGLATGSAIEAGPRPGVGAMPPMSAVVPPACAATPEDAGAALLRGLTRTVAPFTDEVVVGLASGVAVGAAARSGGHPGVTGGARVLSTLVHEHLPRTTVQLAATPEAAFSHGSPSWAGAPAGTVAEALARTADLYPWGSGIMGRPVPGTPPATLAVERVEHADGTTSWTVLVPGTQDPLPPDHPFDAVTDVDLMAHRAADVTVAVEGALELAGALPDEPVVLVGHSLGGIAAMALASSAAFTGRFRLGGVVTAGSPTATFASPPGVPVLHLENDEELVSPLDGRSTTENPATRDRVTVGRALRASSDAADRAASGSVVAAHGTATHLRTLELASAAGSTQVVHVVGRLERLLDGERGETRFFTARRVAAEVPREDGLVPALRQAAPVSPASARTLR